MPAADRQGHLHLGQNGAYVRRHVVRPFLGMVIDRVTVGDQACHELFQVAAYTGVGILADDQRGAGVLQEQVAQPGLDAGVTDDGLHLPGNVVGAASTRVLSNGLLMDHLTGPA